VATSDRPEAMRPMKAVAGDLPPDGTGWWYEVKWDGMRVLADVRDGVVVLRSARGADVTDSYPEVEALADALDGHDALVDGEVVAFGDDGVPSFARLQQRMHVADRRTAVDRAATTPVVFVAFDLLTLDGQELWRRPYTDRRATLEAVLRPGPSVQVPAAFPSGGEALLGAARRRGLEGVVAKRADGAYEPGGRSSSWRKVKVRNEQEFVVAGWLPGTGARARTIGSLVLGCRRDGALSWVGNVGTGFSDRELARLADVLAPLGSEACPFAVRPAAPTGTRAHWLRPRVVVQVAFGEWTTEGRLRHPSYLGQRDDKDPFEVTCDP
jgi:bifunctional non-homologous end joining protein LigD